MSKSSNQISKTGENMDHKADCHDAAHSLPTLLGSLLKDEIELFHETLLAHWNGIGKNSYSLHTLTEEQYHRLLENIDTIAERRRSLGHKIEQISFPTSFEMPLETDTDRLAAQLAKLHQTMAQLSQKISGIADQQSDGATADLMNGLSAFHQKQFWLLDSMSIANM